MNVVNNECLVATRLRIDVVADLSIASDGRINRVLADVQLWLPVGEWLTRATRAQHR